MKQCPVCKTNYDDDSQMFCLNDGTSLVATLSDEATIVYSPAINPLNNQVRIDIPPASSNPTMFTRPQPKKKSGKGLLIGGLVTLLLLAIIGIAGVVGFFLMQSRGLQYDAPVANNITKPNTNIVTVTTANSNTNQNQVVTTTPDEAEKLKKELANLKKLLEKQPNQKSSVPILPGSPEKPKTNGTIARANSPGDGFLALRSGPSSETGDRILQIPHGAELKVLGCQPAVKGKKGRWCRVDYNGNLGWANDGWITY
jgi:hypothetical protein